MHTSSTGMAYLGPENLRLSVMASMLFQTFPTFLETLEICCTVTANYRVKLCRVDQCDANQTAPQARTALIAKTFLS